MTIENDLNSLDLNSHLVEIKDLQIEDLLDFARYGEFETLEAIFESEYVAKLSAYDEHKTSLLHMVAANGHYDCAKLLLSCPEIREKSLNSTNTDGNTPLHWAAFNSQVTLVRLLLEHGADLNIKNSVDRTAFDEAMARELLDVIAAMIEFLENSQNNQDPTLDESESDHEVIVSKDELLNNMDSFPWLEGAFLDFKRKHSISKSRSYSSLCEESNGLIDFVPPTGFAFRFDTAPSSILFKSISLRLPSRAFGIGFIHQSPTEITINERNEGRNFIFGPYFMYGKISANDGGTVEAFYSQKISSQGHLSFSSLLDNFYETSLRNCSSSQSRSHLQWNFGRFALASSFCTFGKILGLQFILNSPSEKINNEKTIDPDINIEKPDEYINRLNFGGEVYYTAQEGSGGISLGLRLMRVAKHKELYAQPLIFTLTGNPLMGHYRSTLTTSFLIPNVSISTRYDVNINSFESDLAVGVAYRDPSPLNQGLRFALGLKNGATFLIQTNLTENIKIRFGLKTGPFRFKLGEDIDILKRSTGSFGLEVAIYN